MKGEITYDLFITCKYFRPVAIIFLFSIIGIMLLQKFKEISENNALKREKHINEQKK